MLSECGVLGEAGATRVVATNCRRVARQANYVVVSQKSENV